jgi:hypothetical protein
LSPRFRSTTEAGRDECCVHDRGTKLHRFQRRAALYLFPDNIAFREMREPGRGGRVLESLSEGGKPERCGWLKDKFAVSWQIVPEVLDEMLNDADATRAERVTQAMLQMIKLDIETLKQAYASPAAAQI